MRRLSTPRLIGFSLIVLSAIVVLGNLLIERLERGGVVETSLPGDRVQFVEERLFAPDGQGSWHTTPYAEESLVRQRFRQDKGDALRVFVLGGSFAMGSPYLLQRTEDRGGGIPYFLQQALSASNPGRTIEVVNAAAGAQNAARVRSIAEQVLTLEPDLLVVASCNNEGELPPSALRRFLNEQGGYRLLKRIVAAGAAGAAGEGSYYTPQDPDTAAVRDGFRENIAAVLAMAAEADVPVLLATLPVNLRYPGFDTGGHMIGPDEPMPPPPDVALPEAVERLPELADQPACTTGVLLFEAGEYAAALPLLRDCLHEGPEAMPRLRHVLHAHVALAEYELGVATDWSRAVLDATFGECLAEGIALRYAGELEAATARLQECDGVAEAVRQLGAIAAQQGDLERARGLLEQAVELEPHNRCRPSFNAILREQAEAGGVPLVDLDAHARELAPDGLPGTDLYLDYCHMHWRGYAAMTEPFLEAIPGALPGVRAQALDWSTVARQLPQGGAIEQIRVTNDWQRGEPLPFPELPGY